nr:hypothetical protein CFP56_67807 [Quercus suber]
MKTCSNFTRRETSLQGTADQCSRSSVSLVEAVSETNTKFEEIIGMIGKQSARDWSIRPSITLSDEIAFFAVRTDLQVLQSWIIIFFSQVSEVAALMLGPARSAKVFEVAQLDIRAPERITTRSLVHGRGSDRQLPEPAAGAPSAALPYLTTASTILCEVGSDVAKMKIRSDKLNHCGSDPYKTVQIDPPTFNEWDRIGSEMVIHAGCVRKHVESKSPDHIRTVWAISSSYVPSSSIEESAMWRSIPSSTSAPMATVFAVFSASGVPEHKFEDLLAGQRSIDNHSNAGCGKFFNDVQPLPRSDTFFARRTTCSRPGNQPVQKSIERDAGKAAVYAKLQLAPGIPQRAAEEFKSKVVRICTTICRRLLSD